VIKIEDWVELWCVIKIEDWVELWCVIKIEDWVELWCTRALVRGISGYLAVLTDSVSFLLSSSLALGIVDTGGSCEM